MAAPKAGLEITALKKTTAAIPSVPGVMPDVPCHFFSRGKWQKTAVPLPVETPLIVTVNGQELVTIMCTPLRLDCLVIGFLRSEGIIRDMNDIAGMCIDESSGRAQIQLANAGEALARHRIRTPAGISFASGGEPVSASLTVTPQDLLALMKQLRLMQTMFPQTGGTHCSALGSGRRILVAAEDIGRHNTLDKILGACLLQGIDTRALVLLTTGRISSEMLLKAAVMQTPVVVSKAAVTERAARLGRELGITVIGYAREGRLSVFSGKERLRKSGKQA